jgi:aminoglycoside phosphotransferase (APT) family kinase protein
LSALKPRESPAATVPLEHGPALDQAALGAWLAEHAPQLGELCAARKFRGGQSNPTYWLDCTNAVAVLRRKPPGVLLKSAHQIEREFRVIQALADSAVPVAPAYALCEDPSVIGSAFYVMGYVNGRIFWDPALKDLPPPDRSAYFDEMARVLAAIHAIDPSTAGLADYGRAGDYFARQIKRWVEQYRASEIMPIAAMDALCVWLPLNVPPDDGRSTLVHGDFRIDNLIFHPTEPRVIAVVDWELSTLGHPLADLSYACLTWRLPRQGPIKGLLGIDLATEQLPSEAQFLKRYAEISGTRAPENWNFYMAFNLFRLGSIAQGVAKRATQGQASSAQANEVGALVPIIAGAALELTGALSPHA